MIFESATVLVFPGGTEIGLEIAQSLFAVKNIRLIAASSTPSNHAPYVFAEHYLLPSVFESNWREALVDLVRSKDITHIFPAHDDVLIALSENQSRIPAVVVTSPVETCRITRSKSLTYRFLQNDVPVPSMMDTAEDVRHFPVFIKPDSAQGSLDCYRISTREELHETMKRRNDFLILEHLPGREFTVDCFSHRRQGLLLCAGRERVRTRSGIAMNSVSIELSEFADFAAKISQRLVFHGAWFFQCKGAQDGQLKLLEVAPRIAGTMCVERAKGINLPLLSLYESSGVSLRMLINDYTVVVDRALTSRFQLGIVYNNVYVDLDDTLIIKERVNVDLVRLLYQSINRGCRVILLTRHEKDVNLTLRKYRLEGIFDKIIHVPLGIAKSSCIDVGESIFIDDSFSERLDVSECCGIPTFDSSSVPCLFDDRL